MGAVALTMTRANPDSIVRRRSVCQGCPPFFPAAPPVTNRPALGTGFVGFGAWSIVHSKKSGKLMYQQDPHQPGDGT
jgi:hypothetical protein